VLRNREDAQDCVHDVLLRVWKNAQSYTTDRGSLRNFLVVCVHNDAISRLRRAARRRELAAQIPADETVAPAFEIPDFIENRRLADAVAALPEEQRSALLLAYYGGKTHVQIAHEQDQPLGTIKGRLSLAVRRLAKELQREVTR
jgi:RNA polymerase sigma-70 factor (ECF subfamily)